jgi:predicted PurR-regulated permease PerM
LQDFTVRGIGPPPEWIAGVPVVASASRALAGTGAGGPEAMVEFVRPYATSAAAWAIAATGSLGRLMVQFLLILLLTAIFYAQGETARAARWRSAGASARSAENERSAWPARPSQRGAGRDRHGVRAIDSRGHWTVALRVPHAGVLTAIAFVLGIAQLGPLPVLVPAIFWLYWSGHSGLAIGLLIWTLPVGALDNVLRPILIRRGVQLPMLLIIAGVIGGLISFGVMGLFIGPVILAATYTLAKEWIAEGQPADTPAA